MMKYCITNDSGSSPLGFYTIFNNNYRNGLLLHIQIVTLNISCTYLFSIIPHCGIYLLHINFEAYFQHSVEMA